MQMVQLLFDKDQIATIMAKHIWYHSVSKHNEELDDIWVTEHPDPHFAQNHGYYVQSLRATYGEMNLKMQRRQLEALHRRHPDIAVSEENLRAGLFQIHALTTQIIEVAGDRQTAKGVWYTPGAVAGVGPSGEVDGFWIWERYGVDFAREDDEWKIWHLHTYTDLMLPVGGSWADVSGSSPTGLGVGGQDETGERRDDMPKPDREEVTYHQYSYKQVPQELPRLPEPYWTFSETFSY
jgi:hypothetical protein